jgi:excinuclease UvrABC nuclease subunit
MNEQLGVCYVGKASMGNCIGSRLSSYFGYESETDRRCKIYHREGWTEKPRYVMCVAVPEDSPFEAPALEEFLIRELAPPDNKRGVPPAVPY